MDVDLIFGVIGKCFFGLCWRYVSLGPCTCCQGRRLCTQNCWRSPQMLFIWCKKEVKEAWMDSVWSNGIVWIKLDEYSCNSFRCDINGFHRSGVRLGGVPRSGILCEVCCKYVCRMKGGIMWYLTSQCAPVTIRFCYGCLTWCKQWMIFCCLFRELHCSAQTRSISSSSPTRGHQKMVAVWIWGEAFIITIEFMLCSMRALGGLLKPCASKRVIEHIDCYESSIYLLDVLSDKAL